MSEIGLEPEANIQKEAKQKKSMQPKNKTKREGKTKRKGLKWIILGGIVVVLAVVVITCTNRVKAAVAGVTSLSDVTVLEQTELKNVVSATGTVESADKTNVYSKMTYTMQNILVKVGDTVQAGDVLCELDKASLEKQIKEREISLTNSQNSGAQSVETARDNYNNQREGLQNNTNSSLISANSNVQNAYDNYQKAIKTCHDYERSLQTGTSATQTQANAYEAASDALDKARAAYETAKAERVAAEGVTTTPAATLQQAVMAAQTDVDAKQIAYDAAVAVAGMSDNTDPQYAQKQADAVAAHQALIDAQAILAAAEHALATTSDTAAAAKLVAKQEAEAAARNALNKAEDAMDTASSNYKAARQKEYDALEDYKINIDTAYRAYQTALQSRTAAEVAADNQLESYKNSLRSAELAANSDLGEYQLEELYVDLENATITAPVSGTVTAVYATEGAASSGLLFIIEDTKQLIVKTNVKEYDVGTVKEGLPVSIKSDATGEDVFEGKVSTIAPTANKNAQGNTDTVSEVQFATEVAVTSVGSPLRIGMSVRLEFIVDRVEAVLSVPYDAIYENADGQTCVLAAYPGEKGQHVLKEMPVTTGMENDLDIAIAGEGIVAGLQIINTPGRYTAGQEIILMDMPNVESGAAMQFGGVRMGSAAAVGR